jgi:hypothetical protein
MLIDSTNGKKSMGVLFRPKTRNWVTNLKKGGYRQLRFLLACGVLVLDWSNSQTNIL